MLKRVALVLLTLGSLVVVVAPSRAATDGKDSRQPIACIKNGAECSGYGCCSQNCVQGHCRP